MPAEKPWKNAVEAASWTRPASAAWPAWPSPPETASAAPTELCAVCASPAGSARGREPVSRLANRDAYTLPIIATPRVPPSSRVASFTAEPTPAFALGTTSMIASVAGALVNPIPVPKRTICAAIVP